MKALEVLEDSPPEALFNNMQIEFGLSEKELFTNYTIFKKLSMTWKQRRYYP
jgi:hypothetical protein